MMKVSGLTAAILAGSAICLSAPSLAHSDHSEEATFSPARVGAEFMVMETAGNEAAREPFLRGLALLHNFEYRYAAEEFRRAQEADPTWVMPYWGEAMTYNHPLWEEQDYDAARAVLARLAPSHFDRAEKPRNLKEAQWLYAMEILYSEKGTKEERDIAYRDGMLEMLKLNPDDIDVRAFAGLAVLGSSHGGRDIGLYMQAAGILEPGFMTHDNHPGILHYLIHSYDDPVHATLGERMAERYAKVAPDAGHAQHMISHIYHALADWEASEAANVLADAVVDRQRGAMGRGPTYCGHYNEWLVYALVQQGKDASQLVEGCRQMAVTEMGASGSQGKIGGYRSAVSSFTTIALYSGTTSGDWAEPLDWGEDGYLKARFDMAYAKLLQSRDDMGTAIAALSDMASLHQQILEALPTERPDETGLQAWNTRIIAQGEAVVMLAAGDTEAGLAALEAAGAAEAELPIVFGPPAIEKPSYEMLGEELLALGRKEEAAAAFRKSLQLAPGRLLSMKGLEAATAS